MDTSFSLFNLLAANHKPGSVVDGHLSGTSVTRRLKPPFREMSDQLSLPFKRCSGWGLQRPYVTIQAGELLPRLSTLTCKSRRYLSVALSLESPPQAVSLHPVLWSPDFPHTNCAQPSVLLPKPYLQYCHLNHALNRFHFSNSCAADITIYINHSIGVVTLTLVQHMGNIYTLACQSIGELF